MLFHDHMIDNLISEDVPYGDLTTEEMGISKIDGEMIFRARFDCVLSGADEASAILKKLGAELEISASNGAVLKAGDHIMTARAKAGILHMGWKVAQNIMEHATGIATRTSAMVKKGRSVNPHLIVACTRKSFPGGKTICMNAVQAGKGTPHRLGVSETFLLFENHTNFFKSEEDMLKALSEAAKMQPEKRLTVECESLEYAEKAIKAGALNIQFDKVKPDKLSQWVPMLKEKYPHITIEAAGGINIESVEEYAKTGIDVAVTSFVYTGKPMDIEVVIRPI